MGDSKLAIAYLRVSTDDQVLGIEAQARLVDSWAEREGVRIVAMFPEHVSGAKPVGERPVFLAALASLAPCGAGLLVASSRDRLARSVVIAHEAESAVSSLGARLRTSDGASDHDVDTSSGLLNRGVRDLFAHVELLEIRARTKRALDEKRARRECVGAVPYGWRLAADGRVSKKSGKPCGLEPVESEQRVIARILEVRGTGKGAWAIASVLNREGCVTRSGKPWSQVQVQRVVDSSSLSSPASP